MVFLFGLEKNDRATIDAPELAALQKIAGALLALNTAALDHSLIEGKFNEICNEEDPPSIVSVRACFQLPTSFVSV
jgi:hypothetical protein